jgi:peptidoglycan hydrolase CwlO-like protein
MFKRTTIFGLVCVALLSIQVQAQESEATPPPMDPATKELNDMLAFRAKLMIEAHKAESEINKAANDPTVTSPEIEKLRKKVEDLQNEIIKAYSTIREEIEKRPEIKEKRKLIAQKEKQIDELNQKINPRLDGKK